MRQNRRHPHDTYSADSYSGDKHRNPCVSDTAECTGKDFDGNIGEEGRHQEMDQSVTDFTHRRICGKQRNQGIADKPHKHNHQTRHQECHDHAGAHTAVYTIHLFRTVVLTDKGCRRNTERIDHHPEKTVHLSVSRPRSHIVGSQRIDSRLNDYIRYRVQNRLYSCRKANADNSFEHNPVNADFPQMKPVNISGPHQRAHNKNRTDDLRQNGRKRRAHNTHLHTDNK